MQRSAVLFAVVFFGKPFCGFCRSNATRSSDSHPIVKVIALLEGLATKAELEGKEEALLFEKYDYWCKNSIKALTKAIEEETAAIAALEDKIAGGEQQKAQLEAEIAALETQLGELDEAAAKAKADREAGKDLYDKVSKDLSETIEAIVKAIATLEGAKAGAFMQVVATPEVQLALGLAQAAAIDDKQVNMFSALLQQPDYKERPEFEAEGDRAAHVQKYEFKSQDVIETLKQLQTRFEDELLATNKAETNAINAYDLAKQEREHVIATAKETLAVKQSVLSDVKGDLATFRSELESEQSDKAADEATLEETSKACMVKKQEWDERSAVRTGEIEAIEAAIKILSEATGVQTEPPTNPVPPPSPVGLVQTAGVALLQVLDPRQKALNLIRAAAHKTHSKALERLAQEMSTHLDDPFAAVINNIEKMIFHLMDEQRQEDEHKAWCDQELAHNNASKVDKETKIAGLTKKIESADAFIVKLSADIEDAEGKIADMVAWMKEATEIREIGKKENAVAIDDAQKAQSAIADATAVIESFYKESGMVAKEAWEALVQQGQPVELPAEPGTWGSSYTGVADPKSQPEGIIEVLKRVSSDFATMEADTRAQEATDQAQYEEEIKDNEIAKAGRESEVKTKNAEKARQVEIVASLTATRKHTSDELEKVNLYLEDLIPACVAGDSTYEDRKAAREEETEALRQAQNILTDAFKPLYGPGGPAPAPAAAFHAVASESAAPARFLSVHRPVQQHRHM